MTEQHKPLAKLIASAKGGRDGALAILRSVIRGAANDGPDCAIIRLAETLLTIRDEDLKAAIELAGSN